MIKEGKVKVAGVPIPNGLWYVALNTARPPFDNVKLRQAIAWAIPYEQIQSSAFFGRAKPMYGGPATVEEAVWPQAFPYKTDLDKAKALMAEAGFASGLETSISLDAGTATVGEPTAVLIQESLGKIGIKVVIEKIPGANWRTTLNKKELPLVLNRFSGWLDYPEYYFFWNFHGNNSIFNISAYKNPAMDQLIERARFTEDKAEYEKTVKEFVALVHAGGADRSAQPADPRRGDAEGGGRLRVLVPPRARLPAIPQVLSGVPGEGGLGPICRGRARGLALPAGAGPAAVDTARRPPHKPGLPTTRYASPQGGAFDGGGVSRVAKGADCKSAGLRLRRFESYLPHQPSRFGASAGEPAEREGCPPKPLAKAGSLTQNERSSSRE